MKKVLALTLAFTVAGASGYVHYEQYQANAALLTALDESNKLNAEIAGKSFKFLLQEANIQLGVDRKTGNIQIFINKWPWKLYHGVCRPEKNV